MSYVLLFSNNAKTTLAASLASGATTAVLTTGSGALFPSPSSGQAFKMTFVDALTGLVNEIVLVTARTGDVITIVRGQEGTTPRGWLAGDFASNFNTAGTQNEFVQGINLQSGYYSTAQVIGGINAIVGSIASELPALPDNFMVRFSSLGANTGPATFDLTLGITDTGAIPIVTPSGAPLSSGEISPVGGPVSLIYSASFGAWVLQGGVGIASGQVVQPDIFRGAPNLTQGPYTLTKTVMPGLFMVFLNGTLADPTSYTTSVNAGVTSITFTLSSEVMAYYQTLQVNYNAA